MTPAEWLKLAIEVAGPVFGAYVVTLRFAVQIGRHLGRQDAQLAEQRRQLEEQHRQNAAQSMQLEWQSRKLETIPSRPGTDPPPRPKLVTLDDPWKEIVEEARKK